MAQNTHILLLKETDGDKMCESTLILNLLLQVKVHEKPILNIVLYFEMPYWTVIA